MKIQEMFLSGSDVSFEEVLKSDENTGHILKFLISALTYIFVKLYNFNMIRLKQNQNLNQKDQVKKIQSVMTILLNPIHY